MTTLALLGGKPVRTTPFPRHPIIGPEEKDAVAKVLDSTELSGFIAAQGPNFLGGRKVKEFEERFRRTTASNTPCRSTPRRPRCTRPLSRWA